MGNDNDKDKEQTVEKDDETVASAQKRQQEKDGHASSITGRPNLDEFVKFGFQTGVQKLYKIIEE